MSRTSANTWKQAFNERRSDSTRYDIHLPLRYVAIRRGEVAIRGTGESVNVSRRGLLFRADEKIQTGDSVVVVVDWPVPSSDNEPLKLVLTGGVVRTKRSLAGVEVHGQRLLRERELDRRFDTLWSVARLRQPSHEAAIAATAEYPGALPGPSDAFDPEPSRAAEIAGFVVEVGRGRNLPVGGPPDE